MAENQTPETAPTAPTTSSLPPADGPKPRNRAGFPPKRGKKLRNILKNQASKVAKEGTVPLKKALTLLKSLKRVKFDESVEVHMSLGIDPKQSDQVVRGAVPLPHGLGRSKKVLVFTQGENAVKAKAAGADFVGAQDIADKITKEGFTDFDVALATPDMMGIVGPLGRVLGPRGLMPSPRAGTVTPEIGKTVREYKAGKVEFRNDAGGIVHAVVGKLSFEPQKLVENIQAFIHHVQAIKPSSVKGHYIKSISLSGTMSPGVRLIV